jgi:hypothetical protein
VLSTPTIARKTSSSVGCFSTYSTLCWRQKRLELCKGAVGDDAALVQDGDPVGELLGLVQVLGGGHYFVHADVRSLTMRHT